MVAGPESDEALAVAVPGYVIGKRLGAGGFGQVFEARHGVLGREVAIKILHARFSIDAAAVARFVAEVRAVSQLSHPGVVEVFDYGVLADGRPYCVMERIRGRTLRDLLDARTWLPIGEALPILRAMAEAIDAVHAAGIAHRDLKPDNVFVCETGGIKLIDFGLAKLTQAHAGPATETGTVFGTPRYMSPEQCRGKASDPRTDAYSFGAVAYHVLVGEPPFSGDALELALHHLHDLPEPPSRRRAGLDERVDRVLLALLAKNPEGRPGSLVDAIDAIAGTSALPRRPPPRWRWLAAAIAATSIAALGLVAIARGVAEPHDDCVPGAQRLAKVWGEPQRRQLQARFAVVGRPDVVATWHSIVRQLDAYGERWTHDWDAACRADDRSRDPLLYAQRSMCLENALIHLRANIEPLYQADPGKVALTYPGMIVRLETLASCSSTEVLRAQVPAPPPEQRAAIEDCVGELDSLEVQRRTISDLHGGGSVDDLLAHYRDVMARLDALHSPLAADAAYDAALLLCALARAEPTRRHAAGAALDEASTLATRYRNDATLARTEISRVEISLDADGPADAIAAALARADAAVARAGEPGWLAIELATQHARFDARHGKLAEAITRLGNVLARFPPERRPFANDHTSPEVYLPSYLARAGRTADALSAEHAVVARVEVEVGGLHRHAAEARSSLAQLEAYVGDDADALAEIDLVLALLAQIDDRSSQLGELRVGLWLGKLEIAARGGHVEVAAGVLQRFRDEKSDLLDIARSALESGELAALGALLEHAPAGGGDALRAELAFARDPASAPAPPRAAAAAFALGARGDWTAAGALGDHAANGLASPWQRAELAAVRGISRVELGDSRGAIDSLEQALQLAYDCCNGFHYFTPNAELALAQALWDTGGDRVRARWLAEHARDELGWLGDGRARDRDAAIRWLDAH